MTTLVTEHRSRPFPRYVAVIGAAGGLGQGILSICRAEGIGFTAIVRSRPERVNEVPAGSRVAVVASRGWDGALNSWFPVSYCAMARWMLGEAAANQFVREAPLVSR